MKYQLLLLFFSLSFFGYGQNTIDFVSSGLSDIDIIRKEMNRIETTSENVAERRATLYRWWRLLLNQGFDLKEFGNVGNKLLIFSDETEEGRKAILEGFNCLEKLQKEGKKVHELQAEILHKKTKILTTDWPQYHGTNTLQAGFSPDIGPREGKVAWKFPKSYGCKVSPIIENGKIYVTGEGGDVIGYCIDEKSGTVAWKAIIHKAHYYANSDIRRDAIVLDSVVLFKVGYQSYFFKKSKGDRVDSPSKGKHFSQKKPLVRKMDNNTLLLLDPNSGKVLNYFKEDEGVTGEACLGNMKLYYITFKGNLNEIDLIKGEKRTIKITDKKLSGSPFIDNGVLFFSSNSGTIFAYNIDTKKRVWKYKVNQLEERSRQLFTKFHIQGHKIYFGSSNQNVYCLNKHSGQLIWKYKTDNWIRATPIFHHQTLYIATLGGTFYALKEEKNKGVLKWKKKIGDHGFETDLKASENGIYGVTKNFVLHSIDTQGNEQWKHSLLDGVYRDGKFYASEEKGGQQSSPVVVDNTLYIGGTDSFVNAIDVATGKEIWKFETVGIMAASPTVANGKVYFGEAYHSTGTYYALEAKTGKIVWSTQEYGRVWVNATFNGKFIYFGNMQGEVFCVAAETGKKIWSYNTARNTPFENLPLETKNQHGFPPGVYCNPIFSDGVLYTGSWTGYYFAIDAKSGKLKWRTKTSPDNGEGGLPDSAAPVLYKEHLYVQKAGYQLAALNKENGEIDWIWTAPVGYLQNGTITAFNHKIYASVIRGVTKLPYDARIIAFNDVENGGEEIWQYHGGGGLTASVMTKDKLIFGSSAAIFATCLDNKTGTVLWKLKLGGTMLEVVPALYGDKAFFQCKNGYLYGVK